ncbi:MAG: hypothetical protein JWM02_1759 [Frankiales bacterium]|nr:hypothetical protein [Frankiales bacterium]
MSRRTPVALALVALLAAACSAKPTTSVHDVSVPAVNGVSPATLLTCRNLKLDLPKQVAGGTTLRPAAPLSDTTAAWGTPPITLRCGVRAGSPLDDPYTFNGVQWAMHDNGASRLWTTLGRKVNVVVEVPDAYSSQAELIGGLAAAVKANLR